LCDEYVVFLIRRKVEITSFSKDSDVPVVLRTLVEEDFRLRRSFATVVRSDRDILLDKSVVDPRSNSDDVDKERGPL
jgi:hypothetical protein